MISPALFHQTKHLNEDHLGPRLACCPICHSTETRSCGVLQTTPDVELMECRTCFVSYASRIPTEEALHEYYQNYYGGDRDSQKVTFDDSRRLSRHVLTKARDSLPGRGSVVEILDFGGGDGSVGLQLAQLGNSDLGWNHIEVTLVDYQKPNARYLGKAIRAHAASDLDSLKEGKFDLILASAVIEHTRDPMSVLRKLIRRLKRGAVFYARTPDIVAFVKLCRSFGIRFDFSYPAHIYNFGRKFWNQVPRFLEKEARLEIIRSTPSIVETTWNRHFWLTLVAHGFKAPYYLGFRGFPFIGGWEVIYRRE